MLDRLAAPPAGHVLILAPTGRDAEGASKLLTAEGIDNRICMSLTSLQDMLDDSVGLVLLADEALLGRDLTPLTVQLAAQPPWSDVPFVVLTQAGLTARRQMAELQLPKKLGNMLVLERPLNTLSLISTIKSSLRARQRQRQVRDYLITKVENAEKVAADLEERVRDRTAALEIAEESRRQVAEALAQSQKMEAVGQLTGGLAHDFNNMLAGIVGSLELIDNRLKRGQTEKVFQYIELAQENARRAAALTHRLLAFSRRQTLDPKPTNINKLALGMMELVRRTLGPEIQINVLLDDQLWLTLSDPHQLENALLNLCINARDAMIEGGTLVIATANESLTADCAATMPEGKPGDYVTLSVTDTGSGMPPEILAKVFEPFFTTKPIGKGTGLGLSMIYGFVRQSGGNVRLESHINIGTSVKLYLPRYDGVEELVTSVRERPAHTQTTQVTVLVVDDEPTIRLLIVEMLEDLGIKALDAANGEAALGIMRSCSDIVLLITDVGMPEMSGWQLAAEARQVNPDIKVLFITGYNEKAWSQSGGFEHGMQVLTKPFKLETLAERVQSMVAEV